jgi:DNA-binding NtrC family response regulator/pSer/pThr/pTyr-binding forkhead associated (FHA) protein
MVVANTGDVDLMSQDATTHEERASDVGPSGPSGSATLVFFCQRGIEVAELVPGARLLIGRGEPADVALSDPSLSRRHAEVTNDRGVLWLRDLGSRNGSFVNGERVDGEIELRSGCELRFGGVLAQVRTTSSPIEDMRGVDTQDQFLARLADELVRARTFDRPLSVLMIRAGSQRHGGVRTWCGAIRSALRPVDRIATYGPTAALVLLPEIGIEHARQLASGFVLQGPPEAELLCGAASFPEAARTHDELLAVVHRAALEATPEQPVLAAQSVSALDPKAAQPIVVRSPRMAALHELVRRAALTDAPVLVLGETGVGKEVVATALHHQGSRRDEVLRVVNCGALPQALTESLLFGHERGAFTGAEKRTKGVFEQADGGTVFLDEVGELSPAAQAALLRILESKRFTRIGATEEIEIDVRIVAATHRDLASMIEEKRFRADLYYRMNTLTLHVPPLRERLEEIEPLALSFLEKASRDWKLPVQRIHPDALSRLLAYTWPGNVRELRNVVERAVILGGGPQVLVEHLPEHLRQVPVPSLELRPGVSPRAGRDEISPTLPPPSNESDSYRERVRAYEASVIVDALRRAGGNRTRAAELLKMPVRTLSEKIRVLDLKVPADTRRPLGSESSST